MKMFYKIDFSKTKISKKSGIILYIFTDIFKRRQLFLLFESFNFS